MKKFVLPFLLLFCSFHSFAHNVQPKEIARKSLLKMTGGKILSNFKLITTFDRTGKLPAKLLQSNPMLDLIDSMMAAAPDSVREEMANHMKRSNEAYNDMLVEMHAGRRNVMYADVRSKKIAHIVITSSDTNRTVTSAENGQAPAYLFNNPIPMLQYMMADSVELHYAGTDVAGKEDCHVLQVQIDGKSIDVMIGKESLLLSSIVIPEVVTDPLTSEGPEHRKSIYVFRNYKRIAGFRLPSSLEVMSTAFDETFHSHLIWDNINQPFHDSTFAREPTPEEHAAFKFTDIGNHLFIMELTGRNSDISRTLVRTDNDVIDVFTGFIYNRVIVDKMRTALASKFPGRRIRNIFGSEAITSIYPLSGLLDANTALYFPKGLGFLDENNWRTYNPQEDSTWRSLFSDGALHPFDAGFEKDGCRVFVLNSNPNPNYDQWQVCYYLVSQKVIFVKGYLGAINEKGRLAPWEKRLSEMIIREELPVERVICPSALRRDAALLMTYEEFQRRTLGQ